MKYKNNKNRNKEYDDIINGEFDPDMIDDEE